MVFGVFAAVLVLAGVAGFIGYRHRVELHDAWLNWRIEPGFVQRPCWFQMLPPREATCGHLYVYENRETKQELIRLPVIRFQATGIRPVDPVLFIQGGPGSPTTTGEDAGRYWSAVIAGMDWLGNRDLIVFDQRGVGEARPALTCPELAETRDDPLNTDVYLAATSACYARLRRDGHDLDAYSTLATADDVEELRRQLGIVKWNLWGASYGSRVALLLMERHPGGLRSVMLESVLPRDAFEEDDGGLSLGATFEKTFAACRDDAACSAAYPHLRERFVEVLERLKQAPVDVVLPARDDMPEQRVKLDALLLLNAIHSELYSFTAVEDLPLLIERVWRRDYDALHPALQMLDDMLFGPAADGMMYSVLCAESGLPSRTLPERVARLYPYLRDYAENAVAGDPCLVWKMRPRIDRRPVTSDVPTLLLAGKFDHVTPPEWAEQAARTLRNGYLFVIPVASHDASDSRCGTALATRFLNDPSRKPLDDCTSDRAIEFRMEPKTVGPPSGAARKDATKPKQ